MILLESRTNKFYHKSIDTFCFIALTKSVAQNIRDVYWKTAEGRTKGAWEPHATLRTAVENHQARQGAALNKFSLSQLTRFVLLHQRSLLHKILEVLLKGTAHRKESFPSKESDTKPMVPNRGAMYNTQGCRELMCFSIYHWKDIFKLSPHLKPNCYGCRKL